MFTICHLKSFYVFSTKLLKAAKSKCSVMILRRCLFLTRNFYSLRQPANINQHTITCNITRNSDLLKRFSTVNLSDGPLPLDPKTVENEDRKLRFIKLEMTNLRDQGQRVPELESVKPVHCKEILKFESASARRKYYNFLFITEKKKESGKMKKQEKKRAYEAFKEQQVQEDNPHITYSLAQTSFLLRIYDRTMDLWRNNRLRRAMQFGDKIIFDCSYDQYMTKREAKSAAKQLTISFAENRLDRDPFDLHFCNVNFNGDTFTRLGQFIPNLRSSEFPLNLCEKSYLDLFPKEQLVYLTPHCRNDLTEYDPDAIYIIGAMVDTKNHEPLSLIKAKELNLKVARLPLDRYLDWGSNSGKTLTLDQMMKIMLGLKASRNWDSALKHVPRRKIVNEELDERREVKKWTVNLNKFKKNFRSEENTFENDFNSTLDEHEQSTLSTAEKFKKKIGRDIRTENSNFKRKFDFNRTDSTISTADKFKKLNQTGGSKNTKIRFDVKELLKE